VGSLTWKAWGLVLIVGGGFALVVFLLLQSWAHYRNDDAALHQQIVPLLNYNLQQGRLVPLPTVPVPPAPEAKEKP
jgi:hypothetical protein